MIKKPRTRLVWGRFSELSRNFLNYSMGREKNYEKIHGFMGALLLKRGIEPAACGFPLNDRWVC
jgi:hypothetical protein